MKNLLKILLFLFAHTAQAASLDLRSVNFDQGESTFIRASWDFYWDELLTPEQLETRQPEATFPMPQAWLKTYKTCCGYATYHLKVEVGEQKHLGLEIPSMSTATRIWVNGQELFRSGAVGTTAETSLPSRDSGIVALPNAKTLDIVVQISNFHHARGGAWRAIRIGNFAVMQREALLGLLLEIALIGAIMSIGAYHLALFFLRREPVTIAFSLCCFAMGMRLSTISSRGLELVCDQLSFETMFRMEYLTLYVAPPLIWLYVQQLFPMEFKKSWMAVVGLIWLGFLGSVFQHVLAFSELVNWFLLYAGVVSCFVLILVLKSVYLKRTAALTIAVGGLLVISAGVIDMINMLVFSEFRAFYFHWGFLLFSLCQSFAIAQIYNQYFRELKREEKMRRHSFNQLAKVFYPHQLDMMREGRPLEETMPTGQSNACVIAFDIVGSSSIEHARVKSFLENSIKHCLSIIGEGYDPLQLTATGYRIKEIGDGFLCSVGYPFRTPGADNTASSAVKLALRFIDIFHEEVRLFAYSEPIFCSIGIADDAIEGYFPSTGTLEYDVYGRSVILATRYEGMRRSLFPNGVTNSVIILQHKVWMNLDVELRARFQECSLEEKSFRVRDDRDARVLYFVEVPLKAAI